MMIAKNILYIFPYLLLPIMAIGQPGEIVQLKPDMYQIEYPNQLINIHFNTLPDEQFAGLVTGLVTTDEEKYEVVRKLKEEIDRLPADFVGKFLSVDIFPLHILSPNTFGYYFDNKIVLEMSKQKHAMTTDSGIENCFLHELAHRLYQRLEHREETKSLMSYLENFQRANPFNQYYSESDLYDYGYVSSYSAGILHGKYEADEEYSELFEALVQRESRKRVLTYIQTYPESKLSQKVNKFMAYLQTIFPSFDQDFFQYSVNEPIVASSKSVDKTIAKSTPQPTLSSNSKLDRESASVNIEPNVENSDKESDMKVNRVTDTIEPRYAYANNDFRPTFIHEKKPKKNPRKKDANPNRMRAGDWLMAGLAIAISIAAKSL